MRKATILKRLSADDGLGMLEIVVSAVIFFFVLTAVLGLLGTTTQMSLAAKQRAVMTNAINAYVERVSAMPFAQVKLVSEGGALSDVETQTVGEYTVVIRPTGLHTDHLDVADQPEPQAPAPGGHRDPRRRQPDLVHHGGAHPRPGHLPDAGCQQPAD
jgi:hypothetical protein